MLDQNNEMFIKTAHEWQQQQHRFVQRHKLYEHRLFGLHTRALRPSVSICSITANQDLHKTQWTTNQLLCVCVCVYNSIAFYKFRVSR